MVGVLIRWQYDIARAFASMKSDEIVAAVVSTAVLCEPSPTHKIFVCIKEGIR